MQTKKRKAVTSAKATAQNYNRQIESYQQCAPRSSQNLKDIIGELIFFLHSPITQNQRRAGWQLFKVLLVQYLTVKGAM